MPYKPTGRPNGRPKGSTKPQWVDGKPNLTPSQWKALEFERAHISPNTAWPSSAKAAEVARYAGVSRQSVHKWRKTETYRAGLMFAD